MVDFFGSNDFVYNSLKEVILPCHPGWKTGWHVQRLVSDGVVQREPGGHGTTKTTGDKGHGDPEVTVTREHERASSPSVRESRHESTHDKGQDRWQERQGRALIRKMLNHTREVKQTSSTLPPGNKGAPELHSMPIRQFTKKGTDLKATWLNSI